MDAQFTTDRQAPVRRVIFYPGHFFAKPFKWVCLAASFRVFFGSAGTAEYRLGVDIALGDLVPPLLPACQPDFFNLTLPALNHSIDVKSRQPAVRVVVSKLGRISHDSAGRRRDVRIARIDSG
jgi:hypothetical protein